MRTRITGRPALMHDRRLRRPKTPLRRETAPGEAGSPRAITVLGGFRVEPRMEQLLELHRIDAHQRRAPVDQLFVRHLDRGAHRGRGGTFAGARLQHEEPAALDGELHVLHVAEMFFQPARDFAAAR